MKTLLATVFALGLIVSAASVTRANPVLPGVPYCSDNIPVAADGTFNIDVTCTEAGYGTGAIVIWGGYSCSYNNGADILPVIVSVNTYYGYPLATGWQTIGQTLASAGATANHIYACVNNNSGEVKIVNSCRVGTNASPCHNNDTCTDLSGQTAAPVYSNPTCQVCITCTAGAS